MTDISNCGRGGYENQFGFTETNVIKRVNSGKQNDESSRNGMEFADKDI